MEQWCHFHGTWAMFFSDEMRHAHHLGDHKRAAAANERHAYHYSEHWKIANYIEYVKQWPAL
jgi:hypothetical protein